MWLEVIAECIGSGFALQLCLHWTQLSPTRPIFEMFFKNTCLEVMKIKIIIFALQLYLHWTQLSPTRPILKMFFKDICLKVMKIKIIIFALQLYLQALNTIVSNLNPCSEDEEIRCFWKLLKLMEIIFIIIFALQLYLQLYLHWTKLSPTKFHVKSMKSFGKIFV